MDDLHLTPEERQTESLLKSIRPALPSPRMMAEGISLLGKDSVAEETRSFEAGLMQVRPANPSPRLWDGIEKAMGRAQKKPKIVQARIWPQMVPALRAAALIAVGLLIATLVWNPPVDPNASHLSKGSEARSSSPVAIERPGRAAPVSHRVGDLSETGIIMQGDRFYRTIEREMIELHHLHIDGDPVEVERPRRERLLIPMEVY